MPQLGAFHVMTYVTLTEFHELLLEKGDLKVILLTIEETVSVVRKLQHTHMLVAFRNSRIRTIRKN